MRRPFSYSLCFTSSKEREDREDLLKRESRSTWLKSGLRSIRPLPHERLKLFVRGAESAPFTPFCILASAFSPIDPLYSMSSSLRGL